MRRSRLLPLVICLVTALLVAGCYQPGGPVPEDPHPAAPRAWTTQDVEAAVQMTQESIYAPLPRTNGTPPAECDNLRYLRFKLRSGGEPDAVLVITPGFMCGANVFNYLGREMVYMAQREGRGNLEVWALEWRSNRAEDLTGLDAAEAAHDTDIALDYYYNGATLNGRTFDGFVRSDQVPWLSEIGLEQAMRDIYTVITTNVPDPVSRRSKVFVGGHSLGGFLTAAFAGWDFDGDPDTLDDAGYRNCAGLVGLDTLVKSTNDMLDPILDMLPQDTHDGLDNLVENTYAGMVDGLRTNSLPRILPMPAITPEGFMLMELMAMEADWAPDQESTLMQRAPYSADVDFLIKLLQSRDMWHYLVHIPGIRDYRFTSEALLGGIIDDNFMPISIMQSSLGFMNGGSMQRKDFPLPGDLANIPGLSELLGSLISLKNMYIPWDAGTIADGLGKGPLYGWTNFDEIGAGTDTTYTDTTGQVTYTKQVEEVTDIADFSRTFYQGPTNFFDWYFSMRLVTDLVGVNFPWGPRYGLNYLHGDHVGDLPKIEFIAEHGPFTMMTSLYPGDYVMCQGYNHVDVLTAAADRPALRPNEVFDPLLGFIFTNLGK
jgi:pimeloyl-ACP methyl ester carboxylesterase